MKILFYDILVQISTSVHPILSVYIFTGSKTIFAKKKSDFFSPKMLEFFFLVKIYKVSHSLPLMSKDVQTSLHKLSTTNSIHMNMYK